MTVSMALAGKGGTGKTTVAALLVRALLESSKRPVLAVDADPNANLGESLGVAAERTVGDTIQRFMDERTDIPAGMTKDAYLELRLSEILVESRGFDLMVMGRPEGQGCYCVANNILAKYVDALTSNYAAVVMDNEAGMEHISRHTTRVVDHLVLVSDNTIRGVRSAAKIGALCDELGIEVGRRWLVINRVGAIEPAVRDFARSAKLEIAASIPDDAEIGRAELRGRSLLDLPGSSRAAIAVARLVRSMLGGPVEAGPADD